MESDDSIRKRAPSPSASILVEGWEFVPLMELCSLIRGVSYKRGQESNIPCDGAIPLLRANNIQDSLEVRDLKYIPKSLVSPEKWVQQGDVVVALSSGSKRVVGKAASIEKPWIGTFGAFCGVLRPIPSIDWKYFSLFFKTESYRERISEQTSGVNINNIRLEYFEKLMFPLPPLAEQRRIVARLEALLVDVRRVRGRLEAVAATMQRFREAVLAAACEGQLTAEWRETNGTKIDEWKIVTVGDISNLITSGSRAWKPFYSDTGASTFILAQNVKPMELNLSVQQRVDPPQNDRERDRTRVQREDILVTIVGANTGDCCRVTDELSDHYVCQSVALIRLNDPLVSCYTEIYLNSPKHGEKQFNEFIYGMGLPHLGLNHLRQTIIQLPPLAEQHEIVRRVDALFALADRIEGEVTGALERVEALAQAVLAKAFRGELVPTEAELARREGRAYEPAAVLLERVRAERQDGRKQPATRGRRRAGQATLPVGE